MAESRIRFPWGLTIACAIVFALLVSLGVWQVQRLQWKEGLIAQGDAAARLPPVTLLDPWRARPEPVRDPSVIAAPAMMPAPPTPYPQPVFREFQRVIANCDWDEMGVVELQSIHDGQPGVRIIGACDGFLVDLGFIPEGVTERPSRTIAVVPPTPRPRPLLTQARTTPPPGPFTPPARDRRFYARDNRAIAKVLDVRPPVGTQVLFAEENAYPWIPGLVAEPPPAAFSNNHLGYALTWFGLALALVGAYVALLRQRLKS